MFVSMAEFPNFGDHCAHLDCNRLDYLPVQCSQCKLYYCVDHYSLVAHHCPNRDVTDGDSNATAIDKRPCSEGDTDAIFECSIDGCHRRQLFDVVCSECHAHFCLEHRYPLEHNCPFATNNVAAIGANKNQHPSRISDSNGSNRSESATITDTKLSTMNASGNKRAGQVLTMRMKQKAIGEKSIDSSRRIYLLCHCDGRSEVAALFVDRSWSIGRCVDSIVRLYPPQSSIRPSPHEPYRAYNRSDDGDALSYSMAVSACFVDGDHIWIR